MAVRRLLFWVSTSARKAGTHAHAGMGGKDRKARDPRPGVACMIDLLEGNDGQEEAQTLLFEALVSE